MDRTRIDDLMTHQDGVISRAQLARCGAEPHDIKRLLRRRTLARLLPGIFMDHTGSPTWQQRAIGGVLHAGTVDGQLHMRGAALGGHAAVRAALEGEWRRHDDRRAIEVCVDHRRTVRPVAGYRFRRTSGLAERVEWLRTPPRMALAEAALDLATRVDDPVQAVGLLADVFQTRQATAGQVAEALDRRPRVAHRAELAAVLADLAAGTCSVLEHDFLERVVRKHALPQPDRQVERITPTGRQFRDCEWHRFGIVVELDGRQFHDSAAQRDVDLERDLDDAVAGKRVVRLGWAQASTRPCQTASKLAVLLRAAGWEGGPVWCPLCPSA